MKKIFCFIFLLIIILIVIIGVLIAKIYLLVSSPILIKEEKIFTLKSGINHIALSNQLYDDKVINKSNIFNWLLRVESSHFKAGTYRFTPGITVGNMLQLLESGKETQFQIRFVEGMRLSNYLKQLRLAPWITHTLKDDSYYTVAKALHIKQIEWLEGWFLPDTWMYTAQTTDVAILKRANKKMILTVNEIWGKRAEGLPYKDRNQFMTMASIVEKETAISDERSIIVSVFINRMRMGMRLQTDPTVIYGIGKNYNGKISRKDLTTLTAYNTYMISNLPPGPIAIPSKASLNAAAHPAKTSYLYFVSNGKGRHIFSTNLISHNESVRKYLKNN